MSTTVEHTTYPQLTPDPAWSGLLQSLSDLGYAKHWANDAVAESYIEAAMKRIREHIMDDIAAVAAPPAWVEAS